MTSINKNIFLITLITLLLSGCSNKTDMSFEEKIIKALHENKVQYTEILHYEVINDGLYVFLMNEEEIKSGVIEINSGDLKWKEAIGSIENTTNLENNLFSTITTGLRPTTPHYIAYGVINSNSVLDIKFNDVSAKIVRLPEVALWIIFSDKVINTTELVPVLNK